MPEITMPNDWAPRDHQMPLWRYLEGGGRRAAAVWHRRAGKDSLALNWTATSAISDRVGVYWHMLPEQSHARKVIWDGIDRAGRRMIDQAFPPLIRAGTYKQEMKIELKNGSIWQCVGSDNFNSLVGGNPVGVVFSEYSIADPAAWDYIRPILAENGGWAIFIYTARGRNHGATLYDLAKSNPGWFAQILTVNDTNVLGPEIIEEERASGMAEDMIQQEYFCSFEAAIVGAYFGKQMTDADAGKRIGNVPWEPALKVHTVWDLGVGDSTSIWFYQQIGREVRCIDYLEASGEGLPFYAKKLQERPYVYGRHVAPHDIRVRELSTGKTRLEVAEGLGIKFEVCPQIGLDDGIDAARALIPRVWFDRTKCERGIEALRQYRKAWDEKLKIFSSTPLHDWSSHAADAFRYLAVSEQAEAKSQKIAIPARGTRA